MLRNYSGYQISKMVNPSKQTKCIANSQSIFPDTLQETLYVEKKTSFSGKPMDLSSFDLLPHQTLWVPGHRHGADPVTLPLSFRTDESATSQFFSPGNSCGYCKIYTHIYIHQKCRLFFTLSVSPLLSILGFPHWGQDWRISRLNCNKQQIHSA